MLSAHSRRHATVKTVKKRQLNRTVKIYVLLFAVFLELLAISTALVIVILYDVYLIHHGNWFGYVGMGNMLVVLATIIYFTVLYKRVQRLVFKLRMEVYAIESWAEIISFKVTMLWLNAKYDLRGWRYAPTIKRSR